MKDKDIKLPDMASFSAEGINEAVKAYARNAVRLNHRSAYEEGWRDALEWQKLRDTGKIVNQEPQPFDLEAAKRGEPLVTRDGRKAQFIGHVPEAVEGARVVAIIGDGGRTPDFFNERGTAAGNARTMDLFMAQKPKRTVYVNISVDRFGRAGDWFYTEKEAKAAAEEYPSDYQIHAIAVPIEIDA